MCEYCYEKIGIDFDTIRINNSSNTCITIEENKFLKIKSFGCGHCEDQIDKYKINYCPICGEKLN